MTIISLPRLILARVEREQFSAGKEGRKDGRKASDFAFGAKIDLDAGSAGLYSSSPSSFSSSSVASVERNFTFRFQTFLFLFLGRLVREIGSAIRHRLACTFPRLICTRLVIVHREREREREMPCLISPLGVSLRPDRGFHPYKIRNIPQMPSAMVSLTIM